MIKKLQIVYKKQKKKSKKYSISFIKILYRNAANELFKTANFVEAVGKYDECLQMLNFERSTEDEFRDKQVQSRIVCMLNKAACNLKVQKF